MSGFYKNGKKLAMTYVSDTSNSVKAAWMAASDTQLLT